MSILSEVQLESKPRANGEVIEFSTTIFDINYVNEFHSIVRRIKKAAFHE